MWLIGTAVCVLLVFWMMRSGRVARYRQRPKSWSEIEAMDRQVVQMQHDQAERGYWGSMEEPRKQDES
jgi:hypothetical protein